MKGLSRQIAENAASPPCSVAAANGRGNIPKKDTTSLGKIYLNWLKIILLRPQPFCHQKFQESGYRAIERIPDTTPS
jgi:hypothetical protein